ncbi:MAG: hypothetical protein DRJ40_01260 [Thermoprotei archaeon]|nr:MAG: hypothetical protein DRJ40_01260 [Thermoprotei archaeon]
MPKLSTDLVPGLHLKNPLILSSGAVANARSLLHFLDLGAVTTKTVTPQPRIGYRGRRVVRLPTGLVNAIGLENPGPVKLANELKTVLPKLLEVDTKVITSLAVTTGDEFRYVANYLSDVSHAFELNISCPHVEEYLRLSEDVSALRNLLREVRDISAKPLLVKLPAITLKRYFLKLVDTVLEFCDCLVVANTVPATYVDPSTLALVLPSLDRCGGYSGPGIKPIVQRLVYLVCSEYPDVSVIATGGVMCGTDVLEYIALGARAVGICSAVLLCGITIVSEILQELVKELENRGFDDVNEIRGIALRR